MEARESAKETGERRLVQMRGAGASPKGMAVKRQYCSAKRKVKRGTMSGWRGKERKQSDRSIFVYQQPGHDMSTAESTDS